MRLNLAACVVVALTVTAGDAFAQSGDRAPVQTPTPTAVIEEAAEIASEITTDSQATESPIVEPSAGSGTVLSAPPIAEVPSAGSGTVSEVPSAGSGTVSEVPMGSTMDPIVGGDCNTCGAVPLAPFSGMNYSMPAMPAYSMPVTSAPIYSSPSFSMPVGDCGCSGGMTNYSMGYGGGGMDYSSLWAGYDCGASSGFGGGGCGSRCGGGFFQRKSRSFGGRCCGN